MEDTVGSRVKLARTKRGLGQGAVCKAVGVSSGYLSLLERASPDVKGSVKNPRADTMQALAYVLDVPTEWLAYGIGDPNWEAPFTLRAWPPAETGESTVAARASQRPRDDAATDPQEPIGPHDSDPEANTEVPEEGTQVVEYTDEELADREARSTPAGAR